MKYRFSFLFLPTLLVPQIRASSTQTLSDVKEEDTTVLPYPQYIMLATGEEPPLRPQEKACSLAEMALAAVGKAGLVIEDDLPFNVEEQLALDKQRHERLRKIIIHCGDELKQSPKREYDGGLVPYAPGKVQWINKVIYRPLETEVQETLSQDWVNLDYCYDDGKTPLLLLIELQLLHAQYDTSVRITYLKGALQKHRASLPNLVKGLYSVCGIHLAIVDSLFPYIHEHFANTVEADSLEELKKLYTQLAQEERLSGDNEWNDLADLGRSLGFTREYLNQLITDITLQPTEDVVKKVETIYTLVMAGGDINQLVIDDKNGLVKLMEVLCNDEAWPAGGKNTPLTSLVGCYLYPRTIDMSSEKLSRIQHVSSIEATTITGMMEVAFAWRNRPDRMHPLFSFLTAKRCLSELEVEFDLEIKRAWQQQVMLRLINEYFYLAEQKAKIEQLASELMPDGSYIQWLYDTVLEQDISDAEFYGPLKSFPNMKKHFINSLIDLGAQKAKSYT